MAKNGITVHNITSFHKRSRFMYAFGDVRLPAPVSLDFIMWFLGVFMLYSIPLFLIIGTENMSLIWAIVLLAPPIVIGSISSKPIFGGRSLIEFSKVAVEYFKSPAGWIDRIGYKSSGEINFTVDSSFWVSRRRELRYLAQLEDKEKKMLKNSKKNKALR